MRRATIRIATMLMLSGLLSLTAAGQSTVTNPRVVEFDPSADHSSVSADGQPMVTRYDLQIYLQGASQPISTASLGKPALGADGKVRVDFSTILIGWPLADGNYEARVAAIGPTGTGVSDVSNLFAFQSVVVPPPCTFALSSASVNGNGPGGSSSVTLTASASTCTWTASTTTNWITIGTAGGTGSGLVSFALSRNSTGAIRTGTVTAGGKVLTVTQTSVAPPSQPKNLQIRGK